MYFAWIVLVGVAACGGAGREATKVRVAPDPQSLDRDGDGVPNVSDACPELAEDPDGFEDRDGCPDLDNDNDGVADSADKCPTTRENHNGVEDDDGCLDNDPAPPPRPTPTDPDIDRDGIANQRDACPTKPENRNGIDDADGCPDILKAAVELPNARDRRGRRFRLSRLAGKTVVLTFAKRGCAECFHMMKLLDLTAQRRSDVRYIAVMLDRRADWRRARRWVRRLRPSRLRVVYWDPTRHPDVAKSYVNNVPSSVVVDSKGRLQARHEGFQGMLPVALTAPSLRNPVTIDAAVLDTLRKTPAPPMHQPNPADLAKAQARLKLGAGDSVPATVRICLDATGALADVQVQSPIESWNKAIIRAASKARYRAYRLHGQTRAACAWRTRVHHGTD